MSDSDFAQRYSNWMEQRANSVNYTDVIRIKFPHKFILYNNDMKLSDTPFQQYK